MILNYIFNFFLILSVVSSCLELTTFMAEKSEKIVNKFEKETKMLLKEKGIGSFVGISFLLIMSILAHFYLQKSLIEFREFQYRKESYLCMNHYLFDLKNFNKKTSKLNLATIAIRASELSGVGAAEAQVAINSIKFLQAANYVSFMKKITMEPHCQREQKIYLMYNFPYETEKGVLKFSAIGTTVIKENKWELYFVRRPHQIRMSKFFSIRTTLQLESAISEVKILVQKEEEGMDLLNLKPLSGSFSL